MKDLLRDAMPPIDTELRRDLWPRMQERLQGRQPIRISHLDWALIAAVLACIALFPQCLIAVLYHL